MSNHPMEGGDATTLPPPAVAAAPPPEEEVATKSRWRPTLEQRLMLENLYNQGIRRPTPEQIQEIVTMLKAFGLSKDIDMKGSSVLYWFQNYQTKLQKEMKKRQAMLNYRRYYFLMHAAASMRNNTPTAPAASLLPLFPVEPSGNINMLAKTDASSSGQVPDTHLDLGRPFHF